MVIHLCSLENANAGCQAHAKATGVVFLSTHKHWISSPCQQFSKSSVFSDPKHCLHVLQNAETQKKSLILRNTCVYVYRALLENYWNSESIIKVFADYWLIANYYCFRSNHNHGLIRSNFHQVITKLYLDDLKILHKVH